MGKGLNILAFLVLLLTIVSCGPSIPEEVTAEIKKLPEQLDFNIHVKPILSDKCFTCHGPDQNKLEADLRLDIESIAKANGAVVEGSLKSSGVYHRIVSLEEDQIMPPPKSNLVLTNREKAVLTKWIQDGAEYQDHWAFSKVVAPDVPQVENVDRVSNEIDKFILSNLESKDLKLNIEADKSTLLRRVSFDLTGLPPTLEDIQSFLADDSPGAFEKHVDRLLASKSYGERMATDWLDVARFADTHGYQSDRYRDVSPWRDWVIKSFNDNMPYNDFVTWQLAGDLLDNPTREQIMATTFLRLHPQNEEGGIVEEEFRVEYVSDRVNTVSTGLMGMTVACAKCHDHKYDPISQKEYYELFSFFNNVNEAGQISFDGAMPVPTIQLTEARTDSIVAFLDKQISEEEKTIASKLKIHEQGFEDWLANENYKKLQRNKHPKASRAFFELDGTLKNKNNPQEIGKMEATASDGELPNFVESKQKKGLQLNGDAWLNLAPVGRYDKASDFNVSLWVNIPKEIKDGVIFHKGNGAAIFNFKGFHLALKDNRLELMMACTAPYNAIIEYATEEIPRDKWIHLALNYDGSGVSDGLSAYLNGKALETEVEVDNLYKDIVINNGKDPVGLQIGARWRGKGIRGAIVDNILVYDRSLSPLEILQIANNDQWHKVISKSSTELSAAENELLKAHYTQLGKNKEKSKLQDLYRQRHQTLDTVPELMVMDEMKEPRQSYILDRGQYDSPTEKVYPSTPESILPFDESLPKNRLGLAKWLLDDDHPLTSRVAVNRYWQLFFGEGFVKTAEDFGNQGQLPKHKELLDWLANDFRENDWSIKSLVKKIVMSATYRQASNCDEELLISDPDNHLLARGPAERLTAEMLRDNVLAGSGLLEDKIGGPSVYPYQPDGLWSLSSHRNYPTAEGKDKYRRSLYTIWKRTVPHPTQATFDAPERSECMVRRQETNTPLQALALMNDEVYLDAAKTLAVETSKRGNINDAFTKLTGRNPKQEEEKVLATMVKKEYDKFISNEEKIGAWLPEIDSAEIDKLDKAMIASHAVVISTIINTDAAIMKR